MRALLSALFLCAACASTQSSEPTRAPQPSERPLPANAPKDRPSVVVASKDGDSKARFNRLVAPYVEKARATYANARARYIAGLPDGHTFFVKVLLADSEGLTESVFVRVDKIDQKRHLRSNLERHRPGERVPKQGSHPSTRSRHPRLDDSETRWLRRRKRSRQVSRYAGPGASVSTRYESCDFFAANSSQQSVASDTHGRCL